MNTALYESDFFVGRRETVMASAQVVVPVIRNLVSPWSVLDVGCGQGEWLEAFNLLDVFGVDIAAPEREQFLRHDLTEPLTLGRKFDLVLSLEVGEHLPEDAADTYVDSLVRHGDDVVFSAAVLGQEGKGHINLQPHEYWHDKFAVRDFEVYDAIRPRIQDSRVSPWYRNNTFLYSRK